jgi:hypothetical protein
MKPTQLDLLEPTPSLPAGLDYRTDFLSPSQESALVDHVRDLDFREFEFHGYQGKRRVVSFGFRYDYNDGKLRTVDDIPAFLLPLRELAGGPGFRRRRWRRPSSPNMRPAPASAGTATGRSSTR